MINWDYTDKNRRQVEVKSVTFMCATLVCNGSSRYVTGLDFCHATYLLPVQKFCCVRLFGCCKDAKKGIHQVYLPLMKSKLGFLFIW